MLPAATDVVSVMTDEATANKLKAISGSNNSIVRFTHDLVQDIEEQLNDKIRDKYYSLQMDKVTDSGA